MVPLHTLAVAMALIAAVVYVVFLYKDRGLPDAREVSAVVSWVLFALVLLVVVQTMTSCPAEHGGIKAFYVVGVVVLLANAGLEVSLHEGEKSRFKGLTWVSVVISLMVILVAANRSACWERSDLRLAAVRHEYGLVPGPNRVAVAEDLIEASALRPRQMKRMLRTLDRSARKRAGGSRL